MTASDHAALEELAAQARAALATPPAPPEEGVEPPPATGTAADGLVSAIVGVDGRVRSLTIDPAMFKRPLEDVTAAARAAVNTALDAVSTEPDFSPIVDLVRDTQAQVRSGLGRVTSALDEVAQQVRSRDEGVRF